jgi:hypothetical protein
MLQFPLASPAYDVHQASSSCTSIENAAGRCRAGFYTWTSCHDIVARPPPKIQGSHTMMVSVYPAMAAVRGSEP